MIPALSRRTIAVYVLMLLAAAAGFAAICWLGTGLPRPEAVASGTSAPAPAAGHAVLQQVLLTMAVVILAARLLGTLAATFGQPPVIGEMVAGILIGPSLLGRVAPDLSAWVMPAAVAPYLEILAQIGVILFMFVVGLELDTYLLSKKTQVTIAISHASIVVPMLLGGGMALWLYPTLGGDVPFPIFALFVGVAMSVTAFPVLARILTDCGIQRSRLGVVAISCAAVGDVTAWCLLALLVSAARERMADAAVTAGLTVAYVLFVVVLVRPLVRRLARSLELSQRVTPAAVASCLVGLLLSALATEYIGIHALFGAFLLGVTFPHDSLLARELKRSLEHVVVLFLLPAFFAFTGLRTRIDLVHGLTPWLLCGAIVLVSSVGKLGGSTIAARLAGLGWREAASVGVLMNTRGLMELVVLNIGLDLGVITPTLFAMMVIMALVTTLATAPALHLLARNRDFAAAEAPAATG